MKHILVYSDSLSWGIIPDTRKRLEFEKRWPGILEDKLNTEKRGFRIIENCLNGRRTVFSDPYKPGRNGLEGLGQVIEYNSPLELVILMLGTNDFQSMHDLNAWHSAQGIRALIHEIQKAPIEPGMSLPKILVVSPPAIQEPKGLIAPKFEGGHIKSQGLSEAFREVSAECGVEFLDAARITQSSQVDGIHLDEEQHSTLGVGISEKVKQILGI